MCHTHYELLGRTTAGVQCSICIGGSFSSGASVAESGSSGPPCQSATTGHAPPQHWKTSCDGSNARSVTKHWWEYANSRHCLSYLIVIGNYNMCYSFHGRTDYSLIASVNSGHCHTETLLRRHGVKYICIWKRKEIKYFQKRICNYICIWRLGVKYIFVFKYQKPQPSRNNNNNNIIFFV